MNFPDTYLRNFVNRSRFPVHQSKCTLALRPNQAKASAGDSLSYGNTFGSKIDRGVWNGQSLQVVAAAVIKA